MSRERWTDEEARSWGEHVPWLVGCNFIPSSAINPLEMWQAETFDLSIIQRELDWARNLGFNAARVYLHDLLWAAEAEAFAGRIDAFLDAAHGLGIAIIPVLFDDVWNPEPRLGRQPEPYPGRHNSGWVQSPGLPQVERYARDAGLRERLEGYVRGVVARFAGDPRVAVWDLYNEPGGLTAPTAELVGTRSLPLLGDAFRWARAEGPTQPLTSGLWLWHREDTAAPIHDLQLAESDVVSFHHYGPVDQLESLISDLRRRTARPLLCTEFMARHAGSRFETHLPVFQREGIGAICWGLVSGKTQTIYPWTSWTDREPQPEPEPWFHDVLRPDGTPFDPEEVRFVRDCLGAGTGAR